jgi:hypothetical protein
VKDIRTSAKLVGAMKVKRAVVSTLLSLAFVSQAFAVLRPPFPAKAAAPFGGELIIIGDDLAPESAKTLAASPEIRHGSQCRGAHQPCETIPAIDCSGGL